MIDHKIYVTRLTFDSLYEWKEGSDTAIYGTTKYDIININKRYVILRYGTKNNK